MEPYIKAEIVRPKQTTLEAFTTLLAAVLNLGIRTLIVWWFFVAWFPDLGLTYWQLLLPIFAFRNLISRSDIGRQLKWPTLTKPHIAAFLLPKYSRRTDPCRAPRHTRRTP